MAIVRKPCGCGGRRKIINKDEQQVNKPANSGGVKPPGR